MSAALDAIERTLADKGLAPIQDATMQEVVAKCPSCLDRTADEYSPLAVYARKGGPERDVPTVPRRVDRRRYRSVVHGHLLPEFGADTRLDQVTTRRIEAFQSRLLAEGRVSPRTVQHVLVLLNGVFKRARRLGWVAANPCTDVEHHPVKSSGDFNVLDPEQIAAVVRAAGDPLFAALILVAATTGLRMGELRALRWRDVDFAAHTVHVRRAKTGYYSTSTPKSGKVRSVPLIDQAARALDGLSRREHFTGPDDLVFTVTGANLGDGVIRLAFYEALAGAGLGHLRERTPPMRFHDLRHSFGTTAVGVFPITDVQEWMGHADLATTRGYVHYVPKLDAAERLSRVWASDGVPQRVPT